MAGPSAVAGHGTREGDPSTSQVPSGILAHAGYIDKDRELIVGLQTDALPKRAIMPFGGWRVVAAFEAYGYKPDGRGRDLHEVPQDPQ
jgi:formate C-acetyltransferase